MKSIQSPKSMFGPWRRTVVALPQQLMMHVSDIVLEDTSGGVVSWRTSDWMSQDISLSFPSTSIAKQRSIVQKMERVASFKENASSSVVTGLTTSTSPASSQEGQQRVTRVTQPTSCTALLFGHTSHGDTIAVQLPFQPWIHIRCAPNVEASHVQKWLASYMPSSSTTADKAVPVRFEVVRMRPFFGVTPDPDDIHRPRLNTYFRFFFNTCDESTQRQFAYDIGKSHLQGVSVDNAKITPYSRLVQHLGFAANQWIKIDQWSDAPYYVTNTQVEIRAHRDDMSVVGEEDAPLDVNGTITATIFSAQYNNVAISPEIGYPDVGSPDNSLSALHVSLNVKRSLSESAATNSSSSSAACWTDLSDHFTLSTVSAEHRERYQLDLLQNDIDTAVCSTANDDEVQTRYCFLVDGALQSSGSISNFPLKIALFESGNDEMPRLLLHVVPFDWMAVLCLRDLLYYASVDIVLQHDAHIDGILQWHARVNMASSAAHEADGMKEIGGELFQSTVRARYGFPLKYGAVLPTSVFPTHATCRHPTLLAYCSKMAFKPCQLERSICKSGREDIEVISYKSVPGVSWIDTSILVRKFKDEEDQTLVPPYSNMNAAIKACRFHELIAMCQSRCDATASLYYTGDMPTGLAALSKLTGLSVFDYVMKSNVAQFWSLVSRKSFQMGVIVDKNTLPMHFNMRGGYIFSDLSGLQTTAELVPDFQSHYLRALIDGNICPSTLIVPFDPVSKNPVFQNEWTSASGNNKAAIAQYDKAMAELSSNLKAIYGEPKPLRQRAVGGAIDEDCALVDERTQSHIDFLVPRSSGISRHVDPRIVTPNCNERPDEITPECHFVCPSQFQSVKFECEGVMPSIFKEIGAKRSEFDAKSASLYANYCVGDKWTSSYHEKRFNNAKANSVAAKLIGNASYGVLVLICPHAAQATTDSGRRLTLFARDATLKQWQPSPTLYARMKHFYDEGIRRGLAKQYDGSPVLKSFRYLCRTYADHRDEFPLEGTQHADFDRPFQISLPGKDTAASVWPINVNVGHTDSIGINLFFLLPCPDGKEVPSDQLARCNTKHHYTMEQRELAFDIGKHMASFVTSLLRSALLDNVTLQFGEMLYPFILSNSSKISYSGIQWKDPSKPASETPKMIQMGTSRRLPLYVGRLIDESVTQLLHSLNPQLVHKAMMLSVQNAVNRALSATSVSQFEEFSMCETLHMPKDRSSSSSASADIVSPHSAANEILKLFAPHAAYRYGASVRYVPMASGNSNAKADDGRLTIFGGVKMRPSLAGCMSLRQLRIMESNQRFITSESVSTTATSSSEKTSATTPLQTPYSQVYWMDNNQLRTLRVDGEAILKRCTTALQDVIFALGDNDGKGWVDPAQSAMLGWTTGCVARSIQQSAVSVASKGKFSKSVQVPAITNFFKKGGAK